MIILIMAIAGILRGIHEGMIHIRYGESMHNNEFAEGVRGHKWHKYYHEIVILRDLSILGLGMAIISINWSYQELLAGLVFMWELSEVGHAIARIKYPVMFDRGLAYERIAVLEFKHFVLRGNIVYALHMMRILIATGILLA